MRSTNVQSGKPRTRRMCYGCQVWRCYVICCRTCSSRFSLSFSVGANSRLTASISPCTRSARLKRYCRNGDSRLYLAKKCSKTYDTSVRERRGRACGAHVKENKYKDIKPNVPQEQGHREISKRETSLTFTARQTAPGEAVSRRCP